MLVADAGHHCGNRPVLSVQRRTTLGTVPADGGEAALDGRNRVRSAAEVNCAGGAGGDVQADDLRIRGRGERLERRHQAEKCFQSAAQALRVLAELAAST